ncbi:MAG: exonuclease [Chloroflexi bacterium RBG_16_48_8]|nr:MAG: exonuclease [Chloroflexi bacterium RBG_16_48_8]
MEIYVSTDIEADGPIPGPYSMLSFGSAAYLVDKTLVDTYTANLRTLPGAETHPASMQWWQDHPEAWRACRTNPRAPEEVMPEYVTWFKSLPGKPVFVAYPAAYDFMFVYWYLIQFAGESPFSHSALDLKTLAMAILGTEFRQSIKRNMPSEWFDQLAHRHIALDDAIAQGALFCNMLVELTKLRTER